ncbi:MAG TPA: DUF3291 domain-containing protein [Magnetospirillaceae bacterium]
MTTVWHLAQMNVGTTLYPVEDSRMEGFTGQLDEINALAEASPGFVWRLKTEAGNATDIKPTDNPNFIVNMSVWAGAEALFDYVYKSVHRLVMVQRRSWFEKPESSYMVLWWVPAGTEPTVEDGLARLAHLDQRGPTPHAFTFKTKFPPPDIAGLPEDLRPEPYCVGWS